MGGGHTLETQEIYEGKRLRKREERAQRGGRRAAGYRHRSDPRKGRERGRLNHAFGAAKNSRKS